MNWYTVFYLMSVADGISTFAIWIAVIATLIFVITSMMKMPAEAFDNTASFTEDQEIKNLNTIWKYATTLMIVFWFVYIAIPERKDMILIVAGGAVGEFVTHDENAQKLPSEVFQYLRKEIIEATVDLDDAVGQKVRQELGVKNKEDILQEMKSMGEDELRSMYEKLNE